VQHWRGKWPELCREALRWLLPAECLHCGMYVVGGSEPLICALCQGRWRRLSQPLCDRCGQPQQLPISCRICRDWPPDFGPVRSAVALDPPVRLMMHRFKYQGWTRLAEQIGPRLAEAAAAMEGELVPIPVGRGRLRSRGYNQALLMAEALAAVSGLKLAPDRLRRVRETGTQTRLGPAARAANLAGAFAASPSQSSAILVDDVFTTGATLVSAAAELLDAGASGVSAVTFARALAPLEGAARQMHTIHPWGKEAF
jgi:ComF family protein